MLLTWTVEYIILMMPIADLDSGTSHKHVAFLKDKSHESTIVAFEEYRVMAERQTGRRIKIQASLNRQCLQFGQMEGILQNSRYPPRPDCAVLVVREPPR
jgi:hypothetical protein